jgi:hypothetical protein
MSDRNRERAREWLEETLGPVVAQHAYYQFSEAEVDSLAALLDEVEAPLKAELKMRCLMCGAIAPENEKDWPDTECVVCTLGAEVERLRRLHKALLNTLAPSKSSWVQHIVRNANAALAGEKKP